MTRPLAPIALSLGLTLLVPGSPAAAQRLSGDYVLIREGTEVLALRLTQSADGRVTGAASTGGASQPVRGSASNGRVTLTMATADGGSAPVTGTLDGDRLSVTFGSGAERETHVLTRRGVGWSESLPAARRWQAALAGRKVSVTERTGGGTSGGATTQRDFHFCPGGEAVLEVASALSVYVPGATGSQTARQSARLRWRVLAREGGGSDVGVEFTNPDDGEAFQLGLAGGSGDVIRFGEKPVRLADAGGTCR